MPFDPNPQSWLPDVNVAPAGSPTSLNLPLSKFPDLAASEVVGPGADFRRIYWALLDGLHDLIANTDPADRPRKVSVRRSTNEVGNRLLRSYTFNFELTKTGIEVIPE